MKVEAVVRVAEMMLDGGKDLRFNFPNLSVYESKFLSNGALIYAPISTTISEQYQSGFVNRVMWEAAFGLAHDKSFIDEYLPGMRALDGFNAKVEEYRKGLNCLATEYSRGIKAAGKIIKEFVKRPIDQARIMSLADDLGKIDTNISKLDGSLGMMKDLHNIEIMDMDFVQYPELARQFKNKYSKLWGIAKLFIRNLEAELIPEPDHQTSL